MSADIGSIIEKGKRLAEQATTEDRAGNAELAIEAYMAASEWFMHATKYGNISPELKKSIRDKVKAYVARAEELKKQRTPSPTAAPTAAVAVGGAANGNERDPELQAMMTKLEASIITNPNVSFDDVAGLQEAKTALREAVILPVKFPRLFRGKRKPWSGILLYGPPGTGKSYLAKAIASECKSTFISVSAADLLARYLGDGEKNVKSLFLLARERKPCVIFIDEIDSIGGTRNEGKHEASSRVLTECLIQMQGVGTDNSGVLVLGATNLPWSLDEAIRRRFERRIYIALPELDEREEMFRMHLGTENFHTIKDHEWKQLAQNAEGYSGADISNVCKEALLRPIRRLGTATHFKKIPNPIQGPNEPALVWLACSPGDPAAVEMMLDSIDPDEICDPPVTMSDMLAALSTQTRSISDESLKRYEKFTKEFGQDGA